VPSLICRLLDASHVDAGFGVESDCAQGVTARYNCAGAASSVAKAEALWFQVRQGAGLTTRNEGKPLMNKLLATLIAGFFAAGAFAQATPATPATPAKPATPAVAATPAVPAQADAKAEVKAETKAAKGDKKAQKKASQDVKKDAKAEVKAETAKVEKKAAEAK
jgi:hypothetical protein